MTTVLDMVGKFHPLMLHLPIGIFIYAYLHLGFDLYIQGRKKPVDINFALIIGALTAVLSSVSGYILSQNGEYGGDLLDWHKWLGIGTAIGSTLLVVVYQRLKTKNYFFSVFSFFMVLLIATGHFGGSLTHGEGFLSPSVVENYEPKAIEDVNEAHVFNDLIKPIFKRKCESCHNPKKTKGELLLHTIDGWKKGGKTGEFIVPGDVEKSLMSTRMHLPLSEKKHMPPSGKLQLEEDEKVFIDWWIKSMSNFDHTIAELSPPEHIWKYVNRKLDVSVAGVPPIQDIEIDQLQSQGIPAIRMGKDLPWLSVVFGRGSEVSENDINKLLKFKENVRELKLSKASPSNKLLSKLDGFSNLKSLDVSLNDISTKGVTQLKNLIHLESLNLYGTEVDAQLLEHLASFPALKDLYLWQTKIDDKDIANSQWSKKINISLGQDLDVFGAVKLLPPKIKSEFDIFNDTASIVISHVAANAKIYYTINGSIPTENSKLYTESIQLNNTTKVKAIAKMNGWENSDIIEKSFLKSGAVPVACSIVPAPNEKYKADGNSTIIDMVKGTEQFADGKWLGFSGQDVSVTLDLGEAKEVSTVSFGTLRDYKSYIFTPIGAVISTSMDGKAYQVIQEEKYDQITGPTDNLVKNTIIDISGSNARFIKLDIVAQKKNPNWHSDPGADSWLFLDEIVIESKLL